MAPTMAPNNTRQHMKITFTKFSYRPEAGQGKLKTKDVLKDGDVIGLIVRIHSVGTDRAIAYDFVSFDSHWNSDRFHVLNHKNANACLNALQKKIKERALVPRDEPETKAAHEAIAIRSRQPMSPKAKPDPIAKIEESIGDLGASMAAISQKMADMAAAATAAGNKTASHVHALASQMPTPKWFMIKHRDERIRLLIRPWAGGGLSADLHIGSVYRSTKTPAKGLYFLAWYYACKCNSSNTAFS